MARHPLSRSRRCVALGLIRDAAHGAGLAAALWPRNVQERMDAFRPTVRLGLGLGLLTLWCVLSFSGVTTFIYSNF